MFPSVYTLVLFVLLQQVSAIWAYSAVDGKELSFKPGDVIWILKRDDSGWWEAMLNGKRGLIPANYVKKIE